LSTLLKARVLAILLAGTLVFSAVLPGPAPESSHGATRPCST